MLGSWYWYYSVWIEKKNNSEWYFPSQCWETFFEFLMFCCQKAFCAFYFMRRRRRRRAAEGLVMKVSGVWSLSDRWRRAGCLRHQGDPVIQTHNKHSGGQGESKNAVLLLVSKWSLCHVIWVILLFMGLIQYVLKGSFLYRLLPYIVRYMFCKQPHRNIDSNWKIKCQNSCILSMKCLRYWASLGAFMLLSVNWIIWMIQVGLSG